jgi:fructose-bisphosphate aldolase class II
MSAVCKQRFLEFGCEGWASKIRPLSTAVMAKKYAAGDLAQTVVVERAAAE